MITNPSLIKQQVTYETIIDWKIHWLTCDLNHKFEFKLNTQQSIDDALAFLSANCSEFNKMVHDFTVMMGFDLYESEVMSELETLDKYATYKQTFENLFNSVIAAQTKLDAAKLHLAVYNLTNKLRFTPALN